MLAILNLCLCHIVAELHCVLIECRPVWQAPWCGHCKRLEPVWHELAHRDLGGVRVCRVDLTKPQSKALGERFAIRGFPTLLFFPAGTEDIYKFTGKREAEALTLFARGGWRLTEVYDPSKQPPPPPPRSLKQLLWGLVVRNRLIFGLLGLSLVVGLCVAM